MDIYHVLLASDPVVHIRVQYVQILDVVEWNLCVASLAPVLNCLVTSLWLVVQKDVQVRFALYVPDSIPEDPVLPFRHLFLVDHVPPENLERRPVTPLVKLDPFGLPVP